MTDTFAEMGGWIMESGYAMSVSQLQEVESFVARWRAFKALTPVRSIDEAEAFCDLDEQAERVADICREVRRMGS